MKRKITLLFSMFFLLTGLVFGQMYEVDYGDLSDENAALSSIESTNTYTVMEMASGDVTYNLNTGGYSTCANPPGIDQTYDCAFPGSGAMVFGTFTDINQPGDQLSSMELVIYGACSGGVEFFINGVSVASGTVTGLSCSCQSIASDPLIPQNFTVTINPAIQAAFVAGGSNTLSVIATGSSQCFYGADVILSTDAPLVPLSNWAIYFSILLMLVFTIIYVRKIFI